MLHKSLDMEFLAGPHLGAFGISGHLCAYVATELNIIQAFYYNYVAIIHTYTSILILLQLLQFQLQYHSISQHTMSVKMMKQLNLY